jgi:hypothetical protein
LGLLFDHAERISALDDATAPLDAGQDDPVLEEFQEAAMLGLRPSAGPNQAADVSDASGGAHPVLTVVRQVPPAHLVGAGAQKSGDQALDGRNTTDARRDLQCSCLAQPMLAVRDAAEAAPELCTPDAVPFAA